MKLGSSSLIIRNKKSGQSMHATLCAYRKFDLTFCLVPRTGTNAQNKVE